MPGQPIPNDWDGETFCCHVIEWPASQQWLAILLGLITSPTRGRFWDGATGSIIDAQSVGQQIEALNCIFQEGNSMGCLEELSLSIQCLCNQLVGISLGVGGSQGAGAIPADYEPFVDSGANEPTGYTDRTEYEAGKCALSQRLIDTWLDSLENIRQIDVSAQGALTLAGLLRLAAFLPIPGSQLLIIASAILGIAAAGIATFIDAIDDIIARVEEMDICILYEATTAENAVIAVHAFLDAGTYSLGSATAELAKYFIGPDAVNSLFAPKGTTLNLDALPAGDCSACETGCSLTFDLQRGTGPSSPAFSPLTFTSAFHSPTGCYYVWATFGGSPGQAIKITDVTGWGSCNPPDQFRVGTGDGLSGNLYAADVAPSPSTCFDPNTIEEGAGAAFIISGNGVFTVTVECCDPA